MTRLTFPDPNRVPVDPAAFIAERQRLQISQCLAAERLAERTPRGACSWQRRISYMESGRLKTITVDDARALAHLGFGCFEVEA